MYSRRGDWKTSGTLRHPATNKEFLEHRNSFFIDQDTVRLTGRFRHKNGEYRWYETTDQYIRDLSGEIIQTICVGRDITDRKEAEEKIAI
ncbi:PAS domain S-box protein [Mesobacillus foraminis]|uniref:PAS domain S-box protein n=1 Tax=Mesobacillus foraminis TaxID=279826 RepID=UPI0028893519|nr:PAS domain S-box protein [Mesobacillus foraminis]